MEQLEDRRLLSVGFRTFDGTGNNLLYPLWGSAGTRLLRTAPADYGDRVSSPAGANRPSARLISNIVMAETEELLNERLLSDFIYVFGQFLDHDLDLTQSATPRQPFPIPVPRGDPFFDPAGTGTQVIGLNRSQFDPATGTGLGNPRQQITVVSAWLDGSQVYGSDATRAAALRTFTGGRLKTSPGSEGDLLPLNTLGLSNELPPGVDPTRFFVAGDIRANENIELTALHTLFLREHNRVAGRIAAANPSLSDEAIYQRARQWVGAELQIITYREFLPALLGPNALPRYTGYQPWVNPGIANEFAHAGFRVGHSFLGDDVEFLDNDGYEIRAEVPLSEAFRNPELVRETGIAPILKYLSADKAREGDPILVNSVRNFLFGPPGAGGFDLGALDIQRARDHGLADYNSARTAYGLPRVSSFAQITSDRYLQAALRDLYGSVNNIDIFAGGLAEDRARGASVGPLFQRIIADQFTRLRAGDRFWYQQIFAGRELAELERTTLADVIRRNTTISNIQDNAFFFQVTISGTIFLDRDGDGRPDRGEPGLGGRLVQLLDEAGAVIATALTGLDGGYRFTGKDSLDSPGLYRIRIVPRPGETLTTANPAEVRITRGMTVTGVDFGIFREPGQRSGPGDDLLADLGFDLSTRDEFFTWLGREFDPQHFAPDRG
ncbi:MAG: peroxidase [Gemmataceae bacterium]|nr:peroxidase [Gemmataceae bacterium]